jgi:hypothetical protein
MNNAAERVKAFNQNLEAIIARVGWAVLYIFDSENEGRPPFAYTVGLAARHLPELLTIGLPRDAAHPLLNALARDLMAGHQLPLNTPVIGYVPGYPLLLRLASAKAAVHYAKAVEVRYDDYQVLQVVWPDDQGRFPGQPGCTIPPDQQPDLATRNQ